MRTRRLIFAFWLFVAPLSLLADVMSVSPATPSVAAGQTFTLTVQMSGASDLYGYQFDIGFDPSILAALSVTEGPFLATGGTTFFIPGAIDNVGGSITFTADTLTGLISGVNGGGELVDLSFRALAEGSSTVQLFNVIGLNSFGQGIDITTSSSTVGVTAAPVPEPAPVLLLGTVIMAVFALNAREYRRRFRPKLSGER